MNYSVYQIQLTDKQIEIINATGRFETVPAKKAKIDMDMDFGGKKIGGLACEALQSDYYTHVANIEADSLNEVFHIGNIGPESAITRFSRMSSLSVSDLICDENGQVFVVAPLGFEPVPCGLRPEMNKEAA
jgi:phosphodiesterase/alkaline phosphatase D-like protein